MNTASWIAVAAAVIAAAGAWYSRLQAGQAKRSAAAAERQAVVAEEQVALTRQQLADERADRHQAAGLHFAVAAAVIEDGWHGQSVARITVEQQLAKNATLTYATNVNSTAQQLIQGQ